MHKDRGSLIAEYAVFGYVASRDGFLAEETHGTRRFPPPCREYVTDRVDKFLAVSDSAPPQARCTRA